MRSRRPQGHADHDADASHPALLPVEVVSAGTSVTTVPASRGSSAPGTIEIELAGARVRVRGTVDEASLRSVLAALRA